jgi:CubicO group peptidase (beta-lactamase class C family)
MILRLTAFCLLIMLHSNAQRSNKSSKYARTYESRIREYMSLADVPGLSVVMIDNAKVVWQGNFGVKEAGTSDSVNAETIFEAASLSKPVFAYGVLKLVDQGMINLDTPLNKYLGNNYDVVDDPRVDQITARRVLSHSSGFPNWRSQDSKSLPINFAPGEKFSYSGEGFVYLSKVVAKVTGLSLEEFVKKVVFIPLQMKSSSFVWQQEYSKNKVYRHNFIGEPTVRFEDINANAAASLHTTASDYARFVIALLNGEGLQPQTWKEMLSSQIKVDEKLYSDLSWGLGIGLEEEAKSTSFWHWGDQGDSKAFLYARLIGKDAILYFAHAKNGLSFAKELTEDYMGAGSYSSLKWLDYRHFETRTSTARLLLENSKKNGADSALKGYLDTRIENLEKLDEYQMNWIGYKLLQAKKTNDAIVIFKQNTVDFPKSGNTWDSLAEAYMVNGNKDSAILYYKKSLEVEPNNSNAVQQLKKLQSQ